MKLGVMQAWLFWKDRYVKHPDAFFGYHFPDSIAAWDKATGYGDCPFCKAWHLFPVPHSFGFEDDRVLCLCELLKYMDGKLKWGWPYETHVQPAYLKDLHPRKNNKVTSSGNIVVDRDSDADVQLRNLLDDMKIWMEYPKTWLTITGEPGSGKTHILRAIKTQFPALSMFIDAASFQNDLFNARMDNDHPVQELVNILSSVPILLFDDFGLEHQSSWTLDTIAGIINNRYRNWKDFITVVTSNILVDTLADSSDIAMRRIGDRLVDGEVARAYVLTQSKFRESKLPAKESVRK